GSRRVAARADAAGAQHRGVRAAAGLGVRDRVAVDGAHRSLEQDGPLRARQSAAPVAGGSAGAHAGNFPARERALVARGHLHRRRARARRAVRCGRAGARALVDRARARRTLTPRAQRRRWAATSTRDGLTVTVPSWPLTSRRSPSATQRNSSLTPHTTG